jgi:hypothetical protein
MKPIRLVAIPLLLAIAGCTSHGKPKVGGAASGSVIIKRTGSLAI